MNYNLTELQSMLKKAAHDFLTDKCPHTVVRELISSPYGYSPIMWRDMADLGWTGLVIPEEHGGAGGNVLDLAVLLEEMGRALLPSPFVSSTLFGLAVEAAGTAEQKKEYLPKVAGGELIGCFALTEPSATFNADGVHVSAKADGAGYVINGTKLFVRDANIADIAICVVRTGEGKTPQDGISLLIVDLRSPGITINPLQTIGKDRQNEVIFADVKVDKGNLLGEEGKGWSLVEKIIQWGAIAESAEMVGAGEQVTEMTVDYAKQRVQFGRPIASFQAIQHKCADMAMDVDGSKFITRLAAWELSEGLPATANISRAKAFVSDAFRRISREAHQIHGGIGFTLEHDLHLYFGKQKVGETMYGDADFHRKIVAREVLD